MLTMSKCIRCLERSNALTVSAEHVRELVRILSITVIRSCPSLFFRRLFVLSSIHFLLLHFTEARGEQRSQKDTDGTLVVVQFYSRPYSVHNLVGESAKESDSSDDEDAQSETSHDEGGTC